MVYKQKRFKCSLKPLLLLINYAINYNVGIGISQYSSIIITNEFKLKTYPFSDRSKLNKIDYKGYSVFVNSLKTLLGLFLPNDLWGWYSL